METHGASGMQVRRTAVSTAETRRKDECVGRALPVAFGISAPSSVRKRRFFIPLGSVRCLAGLYPECVLNPVSAPVGAGNKYFLLEENQVKKRILSLFLAIVMVLGVLPFSA